MNRSPVIPDIPRYKWKEFVDPEDTSLVGIGDNGIEIIEGPIKSLSEPRLEGAPHRRSESIFLSSPGLADTYNMIASAVHLRSAERRRLIDRTLTLMRSQPDMRSAIFLNLDTLSDPQNVANASVPHEAQRFQVQLIDKVREKGLDVFHNKADKEVIKRDAVQEIVSRFVSYRQIRPERKKARILGDARELLRDPDNIDHLHDTFSLLKEAGVLSNSGARALGTYTKDLNGAISHVLTKESLPKPTAAGMEHWVTRWGEDYDELAELVLKKMINGARSPEEIASVMYDVALAGFSSGRDRTMKRTAKLISWSTDLMTPESNQGVDLELARLSLDPKTRQKALELNDVGLGYYLLAAPFESRQILRMAKRAYKTQRMKEGIERLKRDHPDHLREARRQLTGISPEPGVTRIRKYLKSSYNKGARAYLEGETSLLSTHDILVGPLGEWFRDHYASLSTYMRTAFSRRNRKVLAHLNLPGTPARVQKITAEQASSELQEKFSQGKFKMPIEARTYWNTLGYLVPEGLNGKEFDRFANANKALRQEMIKDKIHSLSPRGDHLEIINEELQNLGYENIDFAMHPQRKDYTLVTMRVGEATFRCYLDRHYEFREIDTGHNISLGQHAPFLEFVVLSHLHQIHCTSNEELPEEPEEAIPTGRVEYRRAHRRVLPEGEKPTGGQIIKIWDEYGIDLVRQNKIRIANGETQLITWVSQVKPEHVAGRAPVYGRGDIASERLFELLG